MTKPASPPAPTTTTDLALPTEDPWADLRDAFDDGSAKFEETFGLSLPRLRTDFGRNGKGWIDDLTGEVRNTLDAVLLAYPPTRAWWAKSLDEGPTGPPECRSFDMVRPEPSSPAVQSDLCATCPHSQWGPGGERPSCAESVNVIAYLPDEQTFVWLRFGGTSIKPFRNFVSALRARRRPVFSVVAHVDLEEVSRDRLEWLVPKFSVGAELTPDQVAPMREFARTAMESLQQVATEMATAEAEKAAEAGPDPFPDASSGGVPADDDVVDAEVIDDPGRPFEDADF